MSIDGKAIAFKSTKVRISRLTSSIYLTAVNDGGKESIEFALHGLHSNLGKYLLTYANSASHAEIRQDSSQPTDPALNYTNSTPAGSTQPGDGYVEITKYEDHYIEATLYILAKNTAGKTAYLRQAKFSGPITGN